MLHHVHVHVHVCVIDCHVLSLVHNTDKLFIFSEFQYYNVHVNNRTYTSSKDVCNRQDSIAIITTVNVEIFKWLLFHESRPSYHHENVCK